MLHPLKKLTLLLGVFVLLIFACEKWDFDRAAFIQIITVGAIEVGSNDAFLLGDIDGIRNSKITETGFVYRSVFTDDQNLQLSKSGVIQVVSPSQQDTLISKDQAFAARITSLDPDTKYYFRAYAKLQGDESAYGLVDTFTTSNLNISLPSIVKKEAGCPATTTITIETEGFTATGTGIAGVVWSEDENNEFPTLSAGNILEGAADASGSFSMTFDVECDRTYFLRGFVSGNGETSYGKMLAFTTVEGGIWLPKSSFPGQVREGAMLYSNNAIGYVSGGTRNLSVGEIWSYREDLDQWDLQAQSQKLNIHSGLAFGYNESQYFLTGRLPFDRCGQNDVCKRCPPCSCLEYLYEEPDVIGAAACDCYLDSIIRFNLDGQFEQVPLALFDRKGAIGFFLEDNFIVGGGEAVIGRVGGFGPNNPGPFCLGGDVRRTCLSNFIQFELKSNQEVDLDPLPGDLRFQLVGFSLKDKGYAGLGVQCTQNVSLTSLRDWYELDIKKPSGQQWSPMEKIPSNGEAKAGFSMGERGYVITRDQATGASELWQYDPSSKNSSWNLVQDPPAGFLSIAGSFLLGNRTFVYFLGNEDNFWAYIPELD